MMFSAADIESFLVGKEFLLVLVVLCVVFTSCFILGLISFVKSSKIVKTKAVYDALLRQVEALTTQRDSLLDEIKDKRDQREEYARATKFLEIQPHLIAEQEKLEKSIADKELKLEQLNAEMKATQDKREELKKAEEELRNISRDIADLERDKATITAERDAARKERDEIKKVIAEAKKEVDKLKQEAEKLRREVEDLKREKESLQKWLVANKPKLDNCEDLDRQIAAKQAEVKRLDDRIQKGEKAVADTLDRIDKGLDRLNKMNLSGVQTLRQNAFASLKEGVFSITGKSATAKEDEQDALATVADHMEKSKFVVPERLLYAFHTSLKTSDMSSLTVMAGVSGTGKSAIPKLYSEAMGIHFQPLAVEPRWDSPKDLLGFFNYVTNRYEPTTLARALFQFQGLHYADFKPNDDMKEYMLMPMLDEMNLARIEYYFSEFLSKLEMRRLVAPLTQENLGVVALEVFQGFKGPSESGQSTIVEESPIRLFANQNTLFVGTMNEDETTQSLSDKVIDRANVLYFGRPDHLQAKAGGAGHNVDFHPLLKTTWDSWRRNASEGELRFASEKLAALNRTLADFNRPFAHRTYQAMLSYIANYPVKPGDDRDDVIRRALADQIGMRIMPKLYGVDLAQHQDTFNQVGSTLREIGDPLLLRAFENASDRDRNKSGFFHWTGFDWNDERNG